MIEMSRRNGEFGGRTSSNPKESGGNPVPSSPQHASSNPDQFARGGEVKSDISPKRHRTEGMVNVQQVSSDSPSRRHIPASQQSNIQANDTRSRVTPKPEKHIKYAPAVIFHRLHQGQQDSREQTTPQQALQAGAGRLDASHITNHGTQTSPLDTPAPRRHAPVPHSREPGAKLSHQGDLLKASYSSISTSSDAGIFDTLKVTLK